MTQRNFRLGILASSLALALAFLSGCTSSAVPRRQSGIIVGSQGAGSEVVFPGVQIAALSDGRPGCEYSRRDASLNYHEPMTAFEADAWPQAPQPTLYLARRLSVPTTASSVLYFGTGSQYRSQGSNWQGAGWYWP